MRPRGVGRGIIPANMRALRYQTYYNRGSNAEWKARKEEWQKLETAVAVVVVTPCVALLIPCSRRSRVRTSPSGA